MKITLYSHTGDEPVAVGSAWLQDGRVVFSDAAAEDLCTQVAIDASGPVAIDEPERFLSSLPLSLAGSMLRAEMSPS